MKVKINYNEFADAFIDMKCDNKRGIIWYFNDFLKRAGIKKWAKEQFDEFMIFDLFTDYAIFLLHLSKEEAEYLFSVIEPNLRFKLVYLSKPQKLNDNELEVEERRWEKKLEQRFKEYLPLLPKFYLEIKEYAKTNNGWGTELGKKFSENFCGSVNNPLCVYPAMFYFLTKVNSMKDLFKKTELVFKQI